MVRRLTMWIVVFVCGWACLNRHELVRASSAASHGAGVTFAFSPLLAASHSPVEVEGVVLDDKLLAFNEPLSLPAGWPARTGIRVRNVSSHAITYAMVNLSFPESAGSNGIPYGSQIHLGNLAPAQAPNQHGVMVMRPQVDPLVWLPDTEVTIPLATVADTLIAAERIHPSVSRIEVNAPNIQFQDFSSWHGEYRRCMPDGSHCVGADYRDYVSR